MIDYKYHITALVAVFLALGIGMLIGSMIIGGEFIGEQQKLLVDRLEHDFQQMRIENGLARSELVAVNQTVNIYQQFCAQAMPILIKDKLNDLNVVIIQTNNNFDVKEIKDTLEIAGANVKSVITVMDDFPCTNANTVLQGDLEKENKLVQALGESILFGDNQNVVSDLTEKKFIKLTGDLGGPLDSVIIVGGSQTSAREQSKSVDTELLDYILKNNVNIIGVEPSDVSYSYITLYQAKHIVTIDNIETIPGKVSLVYSLLGEKGDFGIKKTAKKLMPQLW